LLLLRRTIHFNAAHRLWNPAKSDAWNLATFGPGANTAGYGYNYSLEIGVAGSPDPASGMIVNLTDLDRMLKEEVDGPLDHRHLNNEIAEFQSTVPTVENLALWIWRRVEARLAKDRWPCRLSSLVLKVTPNFSVELSAPAPAGS
jgi:6-pyruvoyltetrahydropterin/6-carboxytetrahydropterin synthase